MDESVIAIDQQSNFINVGCSKDVMHTLGADHHGTPHALCYEVQMDSIDIIEMSHDLFSTKFGEDGKANTLAATDYKEPPVVCYSIGSMNSKGMLSSNPRAGIHQTDVARTIDTNGSNPAGYQGGDLIIIEKCYGISRSMLKGGMNAGGMPVEKRPAINHGKRMRCSLL